MRARNGQAGYTAIEVMLGLLILPFLVGAIGKAFGSSDELIQDSRVVLRAHEDLRRNLEAIANVVRDADIDTLANFTSGTSTQPQYQRVVGADHLGRLYGGAEELRWMPVSGPVNGVAQPGVVVHTKNGVDRIIAVRVPQGGFRVNLEGNNLVILLTNYYSTSAAHVTSISGQTAVALRN
ncbi:MAG: hypothetical protein ACYTG6_14035 [Planctomycetota bacterium]|jgi:hypothetical protein